MPSNDENEDEVPKPTYGCGILFGLTNRKVVIEFLIKLKTYPELWRPHFNDPNINYEHSIQQICKHLNDNFNLNMQDSEICLSIQRVKNWYCRMLKNIYIHNEKCNNTVPYKHPFPEYFKILNQFLTSNVHYTINLLYDKAKYIPTPVNDTPNRDRAIQKVTETNLEEKQKTPPSNQAESKVTMMTKSDSPENISKEVEVDKMDSNGNSYDVPNKPILRYKKSTRVYCPAVPIVCDICGRNFKRNVELKRHRVGHFPPQFQCTVCLQKFLHKYQMFKCDHTWKKGKKQKIITDDIDYDIVDISTDDDDDENLALTAKPKETIDDENLPKQQIINPDKTGDSENAQQPPLNENLDKNKEDTKLSYISCDFCERKFKSYLVLRRHRVTHFPPGFQCTVCSKMFFHKYMVDQCDHKQQGKIKRVRKIREGNSIIFKIPRQSVKKPQPLTKWICEICGASYNSMGSLSAHKRDKHFNQRLKCVVCKFRAVSNYRIVQHQMKHHVVEPGTVEEVAKKSRPRMDAKTPYTPEARKEFLWRREMRKKLPPGTRFHGCCKCQIVFQTRSEKLLHNKLEHPLKDTTVICLLCYPDKLQITHSNSIRKHYTDMHKVPWDEIDDLVKRTKPIFHLFNKDDIELLISSENYTELLAELIVKRNIILGSDPMKEETKNAVEILSNEVMPIQYPSNTMEKVVPEIESSQDDNDNVYIDIIVDQEDDQNCDHDYNRYEEHSSNSATGNQNSEYTNEDGSYLLFQNSYNREEIHNECDNEFIEECIVVEEFVDDVDDLIEEETIEKYLENVV